MARIVDHRGTNGAGRRVSSVDQMDDQLVGGLFERDGKEVVPSALCGGPWDPSALHGGPPTMLVGRCIADQGDGQEAWWLSRLTVELVRPVPLEPLDVSVELIRPGRRVELLDASVTTRSGVEVVKARGLRLRRQPAIVGDLAPDHGDAPNVAGPHDCQEVHHDYERAFGTMFMDALELRSVDGRSFGAAGPSQCWARLRVPTFIGEPIGALDRLLAASDFGNGVSNVAPSATHTYINPDVSVHIHRLPEADWVLLDAVTHFETDGFGTASNLLSDEHGRLGFAHQSLLMAAR